MRRFAGDKTRAVFDESTGRKGGHHDPVHPQPFRLVSIAVAAALILIVGVAGFGASPGAILGGLFCLGMMGSMLWMMVAMGTGHGHKSGDNAPDN